MCSRRTMWLLIVTAVCSIQLIQAADLNHISHNILPLKHKDCKELWENGAKSPGVYTVYVDGRNESKIYCNNTEKVHSQFVVIQRRMFGTESFYRGWNDYVNGFGHPQADYWAGLNLINHYTSVLGYRKLRIDVQDWSGNNAYITYSLFMVDNAQQHYRMHVAGPTAGTLPDDMSFSSGMPFYTFDRPDVHNCAIHMRAGWWYNYCAYTLLNGIYYQGGKYHPSSGWYDGIYWKDWRNFDYSLKYTSMTLYQ